MGVKITLRRVYSTEAPATRIFDDADGWDFNSTSTLRITKKKEDYDIKLPLAEFPVDGIESVEFV